MAHQLLEVPELSQHEVFTDLNVPPVLGWEIILVLGCENVAVKLLQLQQEQTLPNHVQVLFPVDCNCKTMQKFKSQILSRFCPCMDVTLPTVCLLAVGK